MERLPLFISFGAFLIWSLTSLFMTKKLRTAARSVGLGLALIQLGSAIWAGIRIFSGTSGVQWSGRWFSLSDAIVFEINFNADMTAMVAWLAVSVFAAALAYFALIAQITGARTQTRGEAVAVPLLGVGALCSLTSANFTTYYFGWALITALGFLSVSFSSPTRDDRAIASFRYMILGVIPDVIFAAGVLGLYAHFGTLGFAEMNAKAGTEVPVWSAVCLIAGTMLRNLQMPLMQCARYAATARGAALPVFFLGHTVFSAILLAKLYPVFSATEGIQYAALVPAFTAIAAAGLALAEEDHAILLGWIVSYVCASVFLAGLVSGYHAAQALALTGGIAAFLLGTTFTELTDEDAATRWLVAIAASALAGIPIAGWGWARYLEYVGLMNRDVQIPTLNWILAGMKVLADLLMGIVLWGVIRERFMTKPTQGATRWQIVIPLAIISLGCLAIATGGRPFGGLLGQAPLEAVPQLSWFERLIAPPTGAITAAPAPLELIGTDADIFARILSGTVLLIPALLAGLWIFRDRKSLEEFRAFCRKITGKLGQDNSIDSKLWKWLIRPATNTLGKASAYFDGKVLDRLLADLWLRPARLVRDVFLFVEKNIIDKHFIDGVGDAVATVGKSLRLIQNGQVQFYFAIGLMLMGAIIIKFVVVGG